MRRIDAKTVLRILREPAISVVPGTTETAATHVRGVFSQLAFVEQQFAEARRELDRLTAALPPPAASAEEGEEPGTRPQRDAEIPTRFPASAGSSSRRCLRKRAPLCAEEPPTPCAACQASLP